MLDIKMKIGDLNFFDTVVRNLILKEISAFQDYQLLVILEHSVSFEDASSLALKLLL
jgi:hypothetical protein